MPCCCGGNCGTVDCSTLPSSVTIGDFSDASWVTCATGAGCSVTPTVNIPQDSATSCSYTGTACINGHSVSVVIGCAFQNCLDGIHIPAWGMSISDSCGQFRYYKEGASPLGTYTQCFKDSDCKPGAIGVCNGNTNIPAWPLTMTVS